MHTGVLDAMLREHAIAPVRNAAHSLDTAGTMWRRRKRRLDFIVVTKKEALPEAVSYLMEFLPVRVTYSLASMSACGPRRE